MTRNSISTSRPNVITSNLACFVAMVMWAVGFPAVEVLLDSWGTLSLMFARSTLSVFFLMLFWIGNDGWHRVISADWLRGLWVGGLGFGFGALLLLVGQKMSDPVTPALAAAMMPIAGAALEVILDKRKLRLRLVLGVVLAMAGGYLATGAKLADGEFGIGALLCLVSVFLFAWATRSTTRDFQSLSPLGQTTITLAGGLVFVLAAYLLALIIGFQETQIGATDNYHIALLLIMSLISIGLAQLLWIWGAGGLGIFLASFHMNAVPFYVMVIVVLMLGEQWQWMQAWGAALVAMGVIISQLPERGKRLSRRMGNTHHSGIKID